MHTSAAATAAALRQCSSVAQCHLVSFNGHFSGTTQVSRYQKGKTNLDFTGARDSEWQWHQLGHMQVCTSLQTDKHASTPQAGCPSCRPTNCVKALKANRLTCIVVEKQSCVHVCVKVRMMQHFYRDEVTNNIVIF